MFLFILLSDWNQEKIDIASRRIWGGKGGKGGKSKGKSKASKPEKSEATKSYDHSNSVEAFTKGLVEGFQESSINQFSTDTTEENCTESFCP